MSKSVYLAGPDVFLVDAMDVGQRKRAMCLEFGFEGIFPLDPDSDLQDDPAEIFRANCALMERADAGLFNLSNFRGPSADAGTVFELGFLFARGKPVYGYSSSVGNYLDRVSALEGALVQQESRFLDGNGYAVEDFGLIDNLMIVRAIEDAGGSVVTVEEKDGEPLAAFRALRETLAILRSRLDQEPARQKGS